MHVYMFIGTNLLLVLRYAFWVFCSIFSNVHIFLLLILFIWPFCLSFWAMFPEFYLVYLLFIKKNNFLLFLSFLFPLFLFFVFIFFLLSLVLFCSFYNFLCCKFCLLIWSPFSFLMYAYESTNFPLNTAFAISHNFWYELLSLSFSLSHKLLEMYFNISKYIGSWLSFSYLFLLFHLILSKTNTVWSIWYWLVFINIFFLT